MCFTEVVDDEVFQNGFWITELNGKSDFFFCGVDGDLPDAYMMLVYFFKFKFGGWSGRGFCVYLKNRCSEIEQEMDVMDEHLSINYIALV